jgi:hypothetical protein
MAKYVPTFGVFSKGMKNKAIAAARTILTMITDESPVSVW